jgi:anthranilate phosphoribosyltransferase
MIGPCLAQSLHPGLRHSGGPRRELGIPTVFNFLGPLTNPARVSASAIGCADTRMAPLMAAVMAGRGDSALVFRGDDGLDELTTTTTSSVWVATGGTVTRATLDPAEFGISAVRPEALRGGDRVHNAAVVREVLGGGAAGVRDAVLLNAAAAIAAHDGMSADTLHDAVAAGLVAAAEAVDSGAATDLLDRWIVASQAARG